MIRRSIVAIMALAADLTSADPPLGTEPTVWSPTTVVISPSLMQIWGIVVEATSRRAVTEALRAPGRVAFDADRQAVITALVGGQVARLPVGVGDRVTAGQTLIEITSADFVRAQNDWLMRTVALSGARSALEVARASALRAHQAGDAGPSRGEVQRRDADATLAEAAVRSAEGEVAAARLTLQLYGLDDAAFTELAARGASTRYGLRAPVSGVVQLRDAVLGAQVGGDGRTLIALADPDRLVVWAELDAGRLARVRVGDAVDVVDLSGGQVMGTVALLPVTIDPATHTGQVRIALTTGTPLRAGQAVAVLIRPTNDSTALALAVPEEAVVRIEGRTVVFVASAAKEGTSFTVRPVHTGPALGGLVPILSGLAEGDRVAVRGVTVLKADLAKATLQDND